MKTYRLHEARAHFSAVYAAALQGEPQRVTRHGKGAVIVIAETEWNRRSAEVPSLASLLSRMALSDEDLPERRPATTFGIDFE
jgi:prevent-host-death family protein